MATSLEELRVLQIAESVADEIWKQIVIWDRFARDVVGTQLVRATDSIGANIAEAFGRFNYGEKIQFLYYARGSLFETKYWLNRSKIRNLISFELTQEFATRLTDLARQLNTFVSTLKNQRHDETLRKKSRKIQELNTTYVAVDPNDWPDELFTETDLEWLTNIPEL
jgi:four helix bundle protein